MFLSGNLFSDIPAQSPEEQFDELVAWPRVRIERIVSTGQATPAGEWIEQDRDEWVMLVAGGASLRFADEAQPRALKPGDWIVIPAGVRHRVERTAEQPTIWLAVHVTNAARGRE